MHPPCEAPSRSGTPDILIRPLREGDETQWYGYLSRQAVTEHTSWQLSSAADLAHLIRGYNTGREDSPLRFGLFDQHGLLVGSIGYNEVCRQHKRAEIAYDLDDRLWGRGIITRACAAVTQWGMKTMGFNRIQATVLDTNTRSARVLEKCGYAEEGLLRAFRFVRGEPRDFRIYSKVGDECAKSVR